MVVGEGRVGVGVKGEERGSGRVEREIVFRSKGEIEER